MVAQHCTLWGEDPSFVIMSGLLLLTHTKPETTELSTDYTFQFIPCVLMLITLMKDKYENHSVLYLYLTSCITIFLLVIYISDVHASLAPNPFDPAEANRADVGVSCHSKQ